MTTDVECNPMKKSRFGRRHVVGGGGLVISRRAGESVDLVRGPLRITVELAQVSGDLCRLAIAHPGSVVVKRPTPSRVDVFTGDVRIVVEIVGRSHNAAWLRIVAPPSVTIVRSELSGAWRGERKGIAR